MNGNLDLVIGCLNIWQCKEGESGFFFFDIINDFVKENNFCKVWIRVLFMKLKFYYVFSDK